MSPELQSLAKGLGYTIQPGRIKGMLVASRGGQRFYGTDEGLVELLAERGWRSQQRHPPKRNEDKRERKEGAVDGTE